MPKLPSIFKNNIIEDTLGANSSAEGPSGLPGLPGRNRCPKARPSSARLPGERRVGSATPKGTPCPASFGYCQSGSPACRGRPRQTKRRKSTPTSPVKQAPEGRSKARATGPRQTSSVAKGMAAGAILANLGQATAYGIGPPGQWDGRQCTHHDHPSLRTWEQMQRELAEAILEVTPERGRGTRPG